jgi:hypothetical protein
MTGIFRLVLRIILIVALLVGAWQSSIWARARLLADRDTEQSLEAAARLVPNSPEFPRELAYFELDHRRELIQRSLSLNPFDAAAWIQLGIDDELRRQDIAAAEKDFLSAADFDHMYVPRWTLENFYLRQNRPAEFFNWAKAALSITPYYASPIFDQIWSVSTDPVRNASILPNRRRILFEYVGFLLNSNRVDSRGASVFSQVAKHALLTQKSQIADANLMDPATEKQISGGAVDKLLIEGDTSQAEALWRTMKTVGFTELSAPTNEHPVSNPEFTAPISGNGFDWSLNQAKGVAIQRIIPYGLRIALDGLEPESFSLLHQFIPVRAGARYRLAWDLEPIDRAPPDGLRWEVHAITSEAIAPANLAQQPASSSPDGGPNSEIFEVPPGVKTIVISLTYTRPLGETRLEGTFLLKKVIATVV